MRSRPLPIEQLADDPQADARPRPAGGRAAFKVNCVQCHGSGARRAATGYPNLNDDDWLWGGDLKDIELHARPRHPPARRRRDPHQHDARFGRTAS
jgi:cbb3-type cytochrome c oxidase subunit III